MNIESLPSPRRISLLSMISKYTEGKTNEFAWGFKSEIKASSSWANNTSENQANKMNSIFSATLVLDFRKLLEKLRDPQ